MDWARYWRHLTTTRWTLRRKFPHRTLEAIEEAIRQSETSHRGEIRFAIEAGFDLWSILRGVTSRDRAVQTFGDLRVWDTEENSGVLIYLLLADRNVEILADRGFASLVGQGEWAEVCREMDRRFSDDQFEAASLYGVRGVGSILSRVYPSDGGGENELPDRPVIL